MRDRDAVRDDDGVGAEVLDDHLARGGRHRDPAAELLEERLQHVVEHGQERGTASVAMWNVATSGPSWIMQVSSDRLGGAGSCTCTTSKSPSRSQRRTRAADTSPNCTRATEPLYGIGHGLAGGDDVGRQTGRVVVARREHRHLVPERDERLGEIADVRLHAAGDVPGVRADDADPHQPARRVVDPHRDRAAFARRPQPDASRSASQSCCSMCQSVGCAAMRAAKTSASAWVPVATWSRSRRCASSSIGGADALAPAAVVGEPEATGSSAAPVVAASSAGPAGIRAGSPKKLDLDAVARQVAVGDQADALAGPQPLGQHLAAGARPAGQRQHLHAEALAVGDEAVEQRLGLEPLGDGRERSP